MVRTSRTHFSKPLYRLGNPIGELLGPCHSKLGRGLDLAENGVASRRIQTSHPSRIVLFDLPPLLNTADVLAFAPYTDALLLVVEDGRTSREDVERALQLVKGSTPVLGTVLNKTGKGTMTPREMKRILSA